LAGTRANLNYLDQLAKFHKQHGNNLNRFPSVDKRPLDLYKLKKAVEVRGGFDKVCKLKKWAEIGRDLGYSGKIMSSLSTSLKNSYQRWLHPYEEYLRIAKPGVQQQLEFEYGGPITPSPLHSPLKRTHSQQNTPSYQLEPSPAIRATNALQASINQNEATPERSLPSVEAPRPISSSGFTAVNSSAFAPINASPSGFVAVNNLPPPTMKRESTNGVGHDSPSVSAANTPEYRSHGSNSTNNTNGHGLNHLKRALSHESLNGGDTESGAANGDADGGSGRRSKRLKKGKFLCQYRELFVPFDPQVPVMI
jgi:[histone H3]-trimethyl-L-lysine4 demethylase